MVRDYSERRQIHKIQPKQRPAVWPYILLILLFMLFAFAAGVCYGWYLYRPGGRFYKVPAAAPVAAQRNTGNLPPQGEPLAPLQPNSPAPATQQPAQTSPSEQGSAPPPLTFYKTLQKGNKELMGTGINAPKEGPVGSPKPSSHP